MPKRSSATASLPKTRERRSTTAQQAVAAADAAILPTTRVGRPRTYSPALCKRAIALGAQGHSWAGIARDFNVSRSTLNKWEAEFPEFSDAMHRARVAAQAWWEDKARDNLTEKYFQANAARLVMTAQFQDYRDAEKGQQSQGLDLSQLVGAISQGVAAATLEAGRAKDDAPSAAQDVVPAAVSFDKPRG